MHARGMDPTATTRVVKWATDTVVVIANVLANSGVRLKRRGNGMPKHGGLPGARGGRGLSPSETSQKGTSDSRQRISFEMYLLAL